MPQPPEGQVVGQTNESSVAPVIQPPQPDNVSPAVIPPPPIVTAQVEPVVSETIDEDKSNTVELRTSEFKRLKEKASEKGRRSERLLLNERAKELGYDSVEDLFAAMSTKQSESDELENEEPEEYEEEEEEIMATPTKKKPLKRQSTVATATAEDRYKRKFEQAEKARKDAVRKWRAGEKRRRGTQRQLAAKEAEMELREVAIQSGIKDVDYSIRLLTRHLSGKTEDDLAAFDEKSFFTGLREDRPYLFGESVMPANTGSTLADSGNEPSAPGPDQTQKVEAESSQFDARKATGEEIATRYKQLGLRQPLV